MYAQTIIDEEGTPLPRLLIVIASTRPGRVGLPVGRWFEAQAAKHGAFEVEVADLAEIRLPFLDEPQHPRLRKYTQQHTRDWSARVEAADAIAFVMPEYNYGYTAPLKNAIDYLFHEWAYKPVGLVSYGGVAAGTRAQQLLKPVLVALRMSPAAESVAVPFVGRFVTPEGEFRPEESVERAAAAMLDELLRLHGALAPLRSAQRAQGSPLTSDAPRQR
jgi:NAD(P)H-dependent FMN reductase